MTLPIARSPAFVAARSPIVTERLVLRPYRTEDFEALYAISSDPEMFRYSERGGMTSEEAWNRVLRHVGHWASFGFGVFAVEERASGRFVGDAGLCGFRRELGPGFDPFPEATWSIAPWAQGQGYATEAAAAALEWTAKEAPAARTVCLIHTGNRPSLRVAEKLGYLPFDRCRYRGYPAILLERLAPASLLPVCNPPLL